MPNIPPVNAIRRSLATLHQANPQVPDFPLTSNEVNDHPLEDLFLHIAGGSNNINERAPLRRASHQITRDTVLLVATAELMGMTFQHGPHDVMVNLDKPGKPVVCLRNPELYPIARVPKHVRDKWLREFLATQVETSKRVSQRDAYRLVLSSLKAASRTLGIAIADITGNRDEARDYAQGFLDKTVRTLGELDERDQRWWAKHGELKLNDARAICDLKNIVSGDHCSDCPLLNKWEREERQDGYSRATIAERSDGIAAFVGLITREDFPGEIAQVFNGLQTTKEHGAGTGIGVEWQYVA